jgi:hypothetical protein
MVELINWSLLYSSEQDEGISKSPSYITIERNHHHSYNTRYQEYLDTGLGLEWTAGSVIFSLYIFWIAEIGIGIRVGSGSNVGGYLSLQW